MHYFAHDLPASKIAELSGVSRAAINQLFMKLRIRIAQVWNASSALSGEVEADKSYFGARRVRGKSGAEQAVKRSSSGSWNATEKCRKSSLTPPRRSYKRDPGSGSPGSIIHADGWRGYNGLVDMGHKKNFRVHHGEHEFARGNFHIDGIESFWSYAKRRLAKFNGVPQQTFLLYLKECEFRFNHRAEDLSDRILTLLKENPL